MGKRKDIILLSIDEQFADQIYSGEKAYEFRKTPIPRDLDYVALLENGTGQITGGFEVEEIYERTVRNLWNEFGKGASDSDRFHEYYDGWDKGVAIEVGSVERYQNPVDVDYLTSLIEDFSVPNQFHFIYFTQQALNEIEHDSRILEKYLPDSKRTTLDMYSVHNQSAGDGSLNYKPMKEEEQYLFRELFSNSPVPSVYQDINEGFINHIIDSHECGEDPYGYFTKRKVVYSLFEGDDIVGFTTTTWKRGGSVKYGPTILKEDARGKGLGPKFRRLIDSKLRHEGIRKTYSTIPENLTHAIEYLIKSGYKIEAHLDQQYHEDHHELVFGKVLQGGSPAPGLRTPRSETEDIEFSIGSSSFTGFEQFVISKSEPWYDEIDESFVKSVQEAEERGINARFSKKGKRVFIGHHDSNIRCVGISSLKRGNAVKISPVLSDIRSGGLKKFWRMVEEDIQMMPEVRKLYTHIPVLDRDIQALIRCAGYKPEGLLRAPYKQGIDLISYGKKVS